MLSYVGAQLQPINCFSWATEQHVWISSTFYKDYQVNFCCLKLKPFFGFFYIYIAKLLNSIIWSTIIDYSKTFYITLLKYVFKVLMVFLKNRILRKVDWKDIMLRQHGNNQLYFTFPSG